MEDREWFWNELNIDRPTEAGWYMVRAVWGSMTRTTREEKAYFEMTLNGGHFRYGFDWCTITHWRELADEEK